MSLADDIAKARVIGPKPRWAVWRWPTPHEALASILLKKATTFDHVLAAKLVCPEEATAINARYVKLKRLSPFDFAEIGCLVAQIVTPVLFRLYLHEAIQDRIAARLGTRTDTDPCTQSPDEAA